MKRFKKGQKVICIHDNGGMWTDVEKKIKATGPRFHEIVTVESYSSVIIGSIRLVEYPEPYPLGGRKVFPDIRFEPLMDITELTEILEQQPEHA